MIWGAILGGVTDIAKDFIKGKAEEQKVKHEVKLKQLSNEAQWENTMADATRSSWKDEFFTIVLSVPIMLVGYSVATGKTDIIDRLNDAFLALENLPDWYSYLLFLAVSASFGMRSVDKLMNLKKK